MAYVDKLSNQQIKNLNLLLDTFIDAGITNSDFLTALSSMVYKESGIIPQNEIMNYSKERLPEVWGVFSKTGSVVPKGSGKFNYNALAVKYAGKPEALANYVYGVQPYGMRTTKYAYGNTAPGDGWKYRGRGYNGHTFKNQYKLLSDKFGVDFVKNPDLINDPKYAPKGTLWYFTDNNRFFKPNEVTDLQDALKKVYRHNAGWGNGYPVSASGYLLMKKTAPEFQQYVNEYLKKKVSPTGDIEPITINVPVEKPNKLLIPILLLITLGGLYVYVNKKRKRTQAG